MKQIRIILITLLLTFTVNADWKPLKSLDHYGPKAFTLKKGVVYVEIRKYSESKEHTGEWKTLKGTSIVRRLYQSTPRSKNIFKRIPMKERYALKKGDWGGLAASGSWYYNGFMLDNLGKTWRLENVKDMVDMLNPIDTPAELSLILWLNSEAQEKSRMYSAKYRKSGSGYVVREQHIGHEYGNWIYGCGDYTFEYKINSSGKITQKKLIRKRKVECGGE